jgi:hypothetical protein
MSIFFKKSLKESTNNPGELNDFLTNTVTMQDDVAEVMINRKRGKIMTSSFNRRKDKNNIQRDLTEVYTDDNGKIPDLTRLDKNERPLWQTILYSLTAVFTVLFIFAAVGFLVFANLSNLKFTNENVIFKIETPLSIVSGQDQEYKIIVTNREKVNLYNLEVELIYPDGFQYISGLPEAVGEKNNNWSVSVLRPGETQEIKFIGNFLTSINSVESLSGTLNFKPENLNSDFRQRVFLDLNVNSSVIEVNLEAPERFLADKNIQYLINLKNLSQEEIKELEIVLQTPDDFTFVSSTPKIEVNSDKLWKIDLPASAVTDLEDDNNSKEVKETKIFFEGNYSLADSGGNRELRILIKLRKNGKEILMAEKTLISKIIKDQLTTSLIINGSAEDQAVNFDDLLFYTLTYKNSGQEEIKNIEVKAILNSEVLLWDTLLNNDKGIKKDNTLTWTGKEIPQLLNLRPGEEGSISWQIRVSDLESLSSLVKKFSIESEVEIKGKLSDDTTNEVKSKKIINTINSDLNLGVTVRYYDDNNLPLGSGPIVPKVGETSSYNLVFILTNNVHDIGDVEVTAVLPRNVSWNNKTNLELGEINYDGTGRRVVWQINNLSRNINNVEANFNLSITPQEDDFGRVLIMLPEIKLRAKDLTTGTEINKSIRAVTTSFKDPILGQLSGIVE